MNKKELAKKLVADKSEAIADSGTVLFSTLDRLDEQYEKDVADLNKPLKWPLSGKTTFILSLLGSTYVENDPARSALYGRGHLYNTHEEARLHDNRRLAEMEVTRRIAEINREEGWEADWSDSGGGQLKFYVNMPPRAYLDLLSTVHTRSHPPHWYGCEKAIKTVIEEMPESCKVMLGVDDE